MTSPLDKKLKITGPVLITANRMRDGAVIIALADGVGPPNSIRPWWSTRRLPRPSSCKPPWRTISGRSAPMWRR